MSKRKLSESKVELTISLTNLLRSQETDARVRRALRPFINRSEVKREFASRVIERIIERTLSGIDKEGSDFKPYSESYKKSRVFQIYKDSTDPNLKLRGEMHSAMETLGVGETDVRIGIKDSDQAIKAFAHITGKGPVKKKRDFFDLPEEEQYQIFQQTISEFSDIELSDDAGADIEFEV